MPLRVFEQRSYIIRTVLLGGSNSGQVQRSEQREDGPREARQVSGMCYYSAGERPWESELG